MATPASYEDTLRRHQAGFFNWLGGLRVDYGNATDFPDGYPFKGSYPDRNNFPILRTFATRDRAFATVVDLLVSMGWINVGTAAEIRKKAGDFPVLPLPVCTIERGDPELDPMAASVPKKFSRSHLNQATGEWESHPWPGTYWLPIRCTFWCSKRYTEAFIYEWIHAQLGKVGAADREVFIPIVHREPWGTMIHALQLEGTSDLSELEGENEARAVRFEVSFRLRMLHFRPNIESAPPANVSAASITLAQLGDSSETDLADQTPEVPATPGVSDNLYTQYYFGDEIASKWPRAGGAIVQQSTIAPVDEPLIHTIAGVVRAVTDEIGVSNRPVFIDTAPNDLALLSVSMRYKASAELSLTLSQRAGTEAPTVWTQARSVTLAFAQSWVDFQYFTLVRQPIFSLSFVGRAISSTVWFTDVDIRHVFNRPRIEATGTGPGLFGGTKHSWNGLNRSLTYLVVVIPAAPTGSWAFRLEDDDTQPAHVMTHLFSAVEELGFVEQMQPSSSSLALTLPAGFVASAIYIQPFLGALRPRL